MISPARRFARTFMKQIQSLFALQFYRLGSDMLRRRLLAVALAALCPLLACENRKPKVPAQWQAEALPPYDDKYAYYITSLHGTADDDIWLGASHYNLHFDGKRWTQVQNKTGRQRGWREVFAVSRDDVWAVGNQGSVAHYDGTAWTEQKLEGVEVDLLHVLAFPGPDVWVTDAGDMVYRFDGKRWTRAAAPELQEKTLHRLWGSSAQDVYVQFSASDDGPPMLLHFDGHDWKTLTLGDQPGAIFGVHGSGPTDVWAVGTRRKDSGRGGQMLHFDGNAWTQWPIPVDEVLWDVFAQSPTRAYACGKRGVMLRWDGHAWTQSLTGVNEDLGSLYVSPGARTLVSETRRLLRKM